MASQGNGTVEMFAAKGAEKIYSAIISGLRKQVGAAKAVEDPKKTSVHITAGKGGTAYAGLHPRKGAVLLNVRLDRPLESPRVRKVEQVSRNRYHCEMMLAAVGEVDKEVLGWLAEAWKLASGKEEGTARK